jgi:hypothetical protein
VGVVAGFVVEAAVVVVMDVVVVAATDVAVVGFVVGVGTGAGSCSVAHDDANPAIINSRIVRNGKLRRKELFLGCENRWELIEKTPSAACYPAVFQCV